MANKMIPSQEDGSKSDNSYSITCTTNEDAVNVFQQSSRRLRDVNNWEKLCAGIIKASFTLCNEQGKEVHRLARLNDYFKIDIPGPGSIAGEGYDWVKIESIAIESDKANDIDLISMRARPATCPLNNKPSIAHFFSDDATSTFLIKREGTLVNAAIHGRNEKPNKDAESMIDSVRNKVIANGAILSFSDIQWKQLVIAFLS